MSGTSLDGADAILASFNPHPHAIGFASIAYPDSLRRQLLDLHHNATGELESAALAGIACSRIYAEAIEELLRVTDTSPGQVTAIGSHGQTVRHRPELGFTVQLQNPALLAELTGIAVVSDFRSRDIAAGGQGAPLAPAFHDAVFRDTEHDRVVINIGGISNATMLLRGRAVFGFDCGPGNMLMDAWSQRHLGKPFDDQGAWAARGKINPSLLDALLAEPYFQVGPPKSSGRDLFNSGWLDRALVAAGAAPNVAAEDVEATLLELTARTVASDVARHARRAEEAFICGGGTANSRLMARLEALMPNLRVATTEELGVPPMQVEAMAFAWLAKQTIDDRALDLRTVTGARHPAVLGAIHPAG